MDEKRSENCPSLEELVEYVEFDRSSPKARMIEQHLAQCSSCANWVQEAEANDAVIRGVFDQDATVILGPDSDSDTTVGLDDDPPDTDVSDQLSCAIQGYEIVQQIGRGGMGVVYKATQLATKREVALKVLLDGPFASKRSKRRFEREVELAAQLEHPNIVTILDSGICCGRHYFAMQHVEGKRLDAYVSATRPNLKSLLRLFSDICEAVNYAHQRGVIHRDLKPSNIRVDEQGIPHILDFGLAKVVTDSTDAPPESIQMSVTGQLLGTLPYMSPEQASGSRTRTDVRTDVYALGVILYELLTGQYPYPVAGPVTDVIHNITETEPEPLSLWIAPKSGRTAKTWRTWEIDNDVETIVLTALAKDPAERYQSAQQLRQDVERYLAHEPIEAKRNSVWYVFKKAIWRHRVAASIAASFIAVVVTGLVVSSTLWFKAAAERDHANRHLYINLVALADASQRAGQSYRAKHQLEQCPRQLRGFEWYWLRNDADRSLRTINTVNAGNSAVRALDFNPNSRILAACTDERRIQIYNIASETNQPIHRFTFPAAIEASFSPNGRKIAAINENSASCWDIITDSLIWTHSYTEESLTRIQWCDSDEVFTVGRRNGNSIVRNARTGELVLPQNGLAGEMQTIPSANPQCDIILESTNGNIEVWNSVTGLKQETYFHTSTNSFHATVSDTKPLIAQVKLSGETILLRERYTGKLLHTLEVEGQAPGEVLFSPDGSQLAAICKPMNVMADGIVALWNTDTCKLQVLFRGHSGPTISCDFSSDSKLLATGDINGEVKLWNTHAKNKPAQWRLPSEESVGYPFLAVSEDGKRYASRGPNDSIALWNTRSGKLIRLLEGHRDRPYSVDFNSDGSRLVSCGHDQTLRVWNADSGKPVLIVDDFESVIMSTLYSPDDQLILTGEISKTIRVFKASTGEELCSYQYDDGKGGARSSIFIDVSPDSKHFVATGVNPIVYVRDIRTGAILTRLEGHESTVKLALFSPDGTRIVTAGFDKTVRIWDAETGIIIHTLHGHVGRINDAAFNSDGSRLATIDKTNIRIWDVESGQELLKLDVTDQHGCFVRFDPIRQRLISIDRAGVLYIWDAAPDPWPYPDINE